jgi:hypothetical protein
MTGTVMKQLACLAILLLAACDQSQDLGGGCPGGMRCANRCVVPSIDPDNCGSCGTTCTSNQVCSNGQCAGSCSQPLSPCSRACVDLSSDERNCGGCGTPCAPDRQCINSVCSQP